MCELVITFLGGEQTGNHRHLISFLKMNFGILREAKRRITEKENYHKVAPFELPTQDDFQGDIPIGIINKKGEELRLPETDLTQHMSIRGRSGAGKTVLMFRIIDSITKYLLAARLLIFDPKREYRRLANHPGNFVVLRPNLLRINFFEPPTKLMAPLDWAQVASEIMQLELRFMTHSKNVLFDILTKLYRKMGVLDGLKIIPRREMSCTSFRA